MKMKKNEKICYALVICAVLFCFLTLLYNDNIINANAGYHCIDQLFSGNFKEYYNSVNWSYGLSIYIIYAVWSIPVWVFFHLFSITPDMLLIPVLLWYKVLLLLFGVWSIFLVRKISGELYPENKNNAMFQYITSAFFIFPVFYISQCDIIGLCFVLAGLYFYIKEENKKFLLFFSIAATMKYFAILVLIPLVLFRYRRLKKVFIVLLSGLVLVLISLLVIKGSDVGSMQMASEDFYVNQHIEWFASVGVEIQETRKIGLFGFFYMILCCLSYLLPNTDQENNRKYAVWLSFASYCCFFLFYMANIYWYVLLAPLLAMTVYLKPQFIKLNILLEIIYETMIIICYSFYQRWVFMGDKGFQYLLLKKYNVITETNWFIYFCEKYVPLNIEVFLPVFYGIGYAAILVFLVINFPGLKLLDKVVVDAEEEKEIRMISYVKIAMIYFWIWLGIFYLINVN